jgi:hypothetical protein
VVTVHGEESRNARSARQGWVLCVVELIDSLGDFGGEGCFACGFLVSMRATLEAVEHLPEPGMPLTAIRRRWLRGVCWNFFHVLSTRRST